MVFVACERVRIHIRDGAMMRSRKFRGVWWLPGCRDHAVAGTLTFDHTGIRLNTTGLVENPFGPQAALSTYPLIYGRTTDSKDLTLCRCVEVNSTWGTGVSTSQVTARCASVGAHLQSLEGSRFRRMAAALAHLPRWTGITGLKRSVGSSQSGDRISRVTHEFSYPDEQDDAIDDCELRFVATARTTWDPHSRGVISQTLSAQLDFTAPRDFDGLINGVLRDIENFLTLAVGKPTYLLSLRVVLADAASDREVIEVLLPRSGTRASASAVEPDRMVFTLNDISEVWPAPLRKLIRSRKQLGSVMDLYFGVAHKPELYIEVQFLSLAQALESFHRAKRKTKVFFRQRVNEVLRDLRPQAQKVVGESEKFTGEVVGTRNYLTHHNPESQGVVSDVKNLILLTQALQFVVEQCLLGEIAVPDAILDRHASRAGDEAAAVHWV